jgi:hypothetical protein
MRFLFGLISGLIVTIVGGIVVHYVTQESPRKERLIYTIDQPAVFETGTNNFAVQNIGIANIGQSSAKDVEIVIDTSHTGAGVKDESVTSSSGPASGIFVTGQRPGGLSISLNSLIPEERIKISLLLTSKPNAAPVVSVKSDASTATLESSLAPTLSSGGKTLEILDFLIPILVTLLLALGLVITGYFSVKAWLIPGWIPSAFVWLQDKFRSTATPGITVAVRPHSRPAGATFQCKIHVDITNQLPTSVRIAAASFVFDKDGPLKPDRKWPREHGTGHFPLFFFSPPTNMHDWRDVYLRPREKTDTWIGIDPQHSDEHIKQAADTKNIGRMSFQMTKWTESGSPETRWIHLKL